MTSSLHIAAYGGIVYGNLTWEYLILAVKNRISERINITFEIQNVTFYILCRQTIVAVDSVFFKLTGKTSFPG